MENNPMVCIICGSPLCIWEKRENDGYCTECKSGEYIKLSNREIVEILCHNVLSFDPRITEIGLQNGTKLFLKKGELYKRS